MIIPYSWLINLLNIQSKKFNSHWLLLPQTSLPWSKKLQLEWFDAEYWIHGEAAVEQLKGRHITWVVQPIKTLDANLWVLRHYYRGGLIAKMTSDRFIYTGLCRTRAFLEISLLDKMGDLGLPVPKVVGARVSRKGISYSADLLMEKIEAQNLTFKLEQSPLTSTQWVEIGRVIAQFHLAGIDHVDLNAHNILIDDNDKVWLIDFDRCRQRNLDVAWQRKNINRLQRSMIKQKKSFADFYFSKSDWQCLLEGYASGYRA